MYKVEINGITVSTSSVKELKDLIAEIGAESAVETAKKSQRRKSTKKQVKSAKKQATEEPKVYDPEEIVYIPVDDLPRGRKVRLTNCVKQATELLGHEADCYVQGKRAEDGTILSAWGYVYDPEAKNGRNTELKKLEGNGWKFSKRRAQLMDQKFITE